MYSDKHESECQYHVITLGKEIVDIIKTGQVTKLGTWLDDKFSVVLRNEKLKKYIYLFMFTLSS